MDEESRTKIASALQQYRETVSQHNLFLLRILVEKLEEEPLPPQISPSVAKQLHIREIGRFLQCALPESVKSPRDVLNDDMRAEMIRRAKLDGVVHLPVNLETREEYFASIKTCIAEKNVEVAEFPPADLEYLCTLVSGVSGPGLGNHRWSQQFAFVSYILGAVNPEIILQSVTVPIRDHRRAEWCSGWEDIWMDWEIPIAFRIGGGPRAGGSYALYCRNKENEQWKWSVEEFLGFYAHFRETTEEEVRKSTRSLKGFLHIHH